MENRFIDKKGAKAKRKNINVKDQVNLSPTQIKKRISSLTQSSIKNTLKCAKRKNIINEATLKGRNYFQIHKTSSSQNFKKKIVSNRFSNPSSKKKTKKSMKKKTTKINSSAAKYLSNQFAPEDLFSLNVHNITEDDLLLGSENRPSKNQENESSILGSDFIDEIKRDEISLNQDEGPQNPFELCKLYEDDLKDDSSEPKTVHSVRKEISADSQLEQKLGIIDLTRNSGGLIPRKQITVKNCKNNSESISKTTAVPPSFIYSTDAKMDQKSEDKFSKSDYEMVKNLKSVRSEGNQESFSPRGSQETFERKALSLCKGDEQLLQKFDKEVIKILQIGYELQRKLKEEISSSISNSSDADALIKLLYSKNLNSPS